MKFFISHLLSKAINFLSLREIVPFLSYSVAFEGSLSNIFPIYYQNKKLKSLIATIPNNQCKQLLTSIFMFDSGI